MHCTPVFSKLLHAYLNPKIRVIIMVGGTRSSKTYSIIQLLDYIGRKSTKRNRLISVVSETMPHLKRGAIRDFKNILQGEGITIGREFNETDKVYDYGRAQLEFFSADNAGKVHGSQREVLFVNEALFLGWEIYRQLAIRTSEKIIIDYNPAWEFWADSKLIPRDDVVVIHSTYKDNDRLTESQISEIESNREIDPDWWKVYGEGQKGTIAGLVMKRWDIVDKLPARSTWKKAFIGVDFGWSNPTAVMLVVLGERNEVWIHEILYARNKDNPEIANAIHDSGYADLDVICDEAEPKSIAELVGHGIKARKTQNKDIKLGIRIMNRYTKHYTKESVGSIGENRKYKYPPNEEGTYDEGGLPIDKNNHAKDAERYIFLNELSDIPTTSFDMDDISIL